jgi:hypothetical protein
MQVALNTVLVAVAVHSRKVWSTEKGFKLNSVNESLYAIHSLKR